MLWPAEELMRPVCAGMPRGPGRPRGPAPPSFPRKRESSPEQTHEPQAAAVYILASRRNGTLYVGVTSDLRQRIWEHRNDLREGFTERYGVHRLVYYKLHDDMMTAITREKRLKKWNRAWKLQLIEKENPGWSGLWEQIS